MERCGQQTLSGGLRIKMPGALYLTGLELARFVVLYLFILWLSRICQAGKDLEAVKRFNTAVAAASQKENGQGRDLSLAFANRWHWQVILLFCTPKTGSPNLALSFTLSFTHPQSIRRSAALFKLGHPLLALEDIAEALAAGYPQDLTFKVKSEILSFYSQ